MDIRYLASADEIARVAADAIIAAVRARPDLLLCAATGDSPTKTYALLAAAGASDPGLFAGMRVLKLDEWGGLAMNDPGTCESYLQKHLIGPLGIPPHRYLSFESDVPDPGAECRRISAELKAWGPIGFCVLGIGVNGHIGLNEPALSLQPYAHVAALSETSAAHSMLVHSARPPYGVTLGVEEIFQSEQIVLLISGKKKAAVTRSLLTGSIGTALPASLLRLHRFVLCLIDPDAAVDA